MPWFAHRSPLESARFAVTGETASAPRGPRPIGQMRPLLGLSLGAHPLISGQVRSRRRPTGAQATSGSRQRARRARRTASGDRRRPRGETTRTGGGWRGGGRSRPGSTRRRRPRVPVPGSRAARASARSPPGTSRRSRRSAGRTRAGLPRRATARRAGRPAPRSARGGWPPNVGADDRFVDVGGELAEDGRVLLDEPKER